MSPLEALTAVFAPALLWAAYHYHKDRHQPEPLVVLGALYVLGFIMAWVNAHGYEGLRALGVSTNAYALAQDGDWWGLLSFSVLVIGLGEELSKFLPFVLLASHLKHFDEPIDGIIYASFVALGFASFENLHLLHHLQGWEAAGRALASPAVHVMFSSIWGYTFGGAVLRGHGRWWAAIVGLALSALAHGLYDFIAIGFSAWARIGPPALLLGLWVWRLHLLRRLHIRS